MKYFSNKEPFEADIIHDYSEDYDDDDTHPIGLSYSFEHLDFFGLFYDLLGALKMFDGLDMTHEYGTEVHYFYFKTRSDAEKFRSRLNTLVIDLHKGNATFDIVFKPHKFTHSK